MGIKTIDACEVSCQECPATIIVQDWRDAADAGWCVPTDGHLHLCPDCLAKRHDNMSDLATKAKVYQACYNIAVAASAASTRYYANHHGVCSVAIAHVANEPAIAIHSLALAENIDLQDTPSDVQAASGSTNDTA